MSHFLYLAVCCCAGSRLVNEKQLMAVARAIGKCWREIGRVALDVPTVKLEQIEEDHSYHEERVFAMLRYWKTCQRQKATAARLHSLLSEGEWALPTESIDFLMKTDWGPQCPVPVETQTLSRGIFLVEISVFLIIETVIPYHLNTKLEDYLMGPIHSCSIFSVCQQFS